MNSSDRKMVNLLRQATNNPDLQLKDVKQKVNVPDSGALFWVDGIVCCVDAAKVRAGADSHLFRQWEW